jgi:hypothetical protein
MDSIIYRLLNGLLVENRLWLCHILKKRLIEKALANPLAEVFRSVF